MDMDNGEIQVLTNRRCAADHIAKSLWANRTVDEDSG